MKASKVQEFPLELTREDILHDYRLAYKSRQVSLIGKREVMSGKAKFGIFGDGKEIIQVAMARAYHKGDIRSGYYRDQTLIFALNGDQAIQQFFAQLYAHTDLDAEPATAGRAMNAHFATRALNPDGSWKDLTKQFYTSADVSPTGSQMPRLVGLAYASRLYRQLDELKSFSQFSHHGDEIAFGNIGNASTAEGIFWEAVNAIGVLHAPALLTIYDDGYGISVPNEFQMVKQNLYELLQGFQRQPGTEDGYDLYTVKGWDYPALINTYQTAAEIVRREQVPAIIHVTEVTQPQGHSTSGSQERYKSPERLAWEKEFDGLKKFRQWMLDNQVITEEELKHLERKDTKTVENLRKAAWEAYFSAIQQDRQAVAALIDRIAENSAYTESLMDLKNRVLNNPAPFRREIMSAVQSVLLVTRDEATSAHQELIKWKENIEALSEERYSSYLYDPGPGSALKVAEIKATYAPDAPLVYGFEVLNACFDAALAREPRLIAFGEDVGKLGDVNQGFRGLQDKYGVLRVADTGIRETTILGQAIGMAMRGLRPIAEIQYLDYLLYGLQIMSDDLATLLWRTRGGQRAPVIVRTRGHRLEGIWHSGSLLAGILNLARGMHLLVPRDMTQAAGFYNTLLKAQEPALIIEVLNGYRVKERLPENIGEFCTPLGIPEIIRPGTDITLVTYGACCRIVLEAAGRLSQAGIEAEVVDVQTLLPFDLHGIILESLKKTSRILFIDEDVPGGTTAYMLEQVIEKQGGYFWLDSPPRTLPGKPHRPAYGSDGDYWSKPNTEQVFEVVYEIMNEANPVKYPMFFK